MKDSITSEQCGWKSDRRRAREFAAARQRFFERLSSGIPHEPSRDYQFVCEAWCEAIGAEWGWLWLADQLPRPTELQLVGGYSKSAILPLPEQLAVTNVNSAAAFCLEQGRPQYIEDIKGWRGGFDSRYKVGLADFLNQHACTSFLCVPLIAPPNEARPGDTWTERVHGALCLHFKDGTKQSFDSPQMILLMACLTGHFIESSHYAQQRRLNLELSRIAHEHVAVANTSALRRRSAYARGVINLLSQELNVHGLSIFFHDPIRECLECVATTGLVNNRGEPVYNISGVTYKAGVGMTGQCYLTGLPYFSQSHASAGEGEPRFLETTEDNLRTPASAIYPIPGCTSSHLTKTQPLSSGVMRLVQHFNPQFGSRRIKFDSLRLTTLEAVGRQVGLVLKGMTNSIQKEDILKSVRHDNDYALAILHDLSTQVAESEPQVLASGLQGICFSRDDADDIGFTAMLLQNISRYISTETDDEPRMENTDVAEAVLAISKLVARHFPKKLGKQFNIQVDATPHLPRAFIDRSMLIRAVFNLLINAADYCEVRTTIEVNIHLFHGTVCIDVINSGPGIPLTDIDSVFLPGVTGRKSMKDGHGMGLTVARRMIQRIGGQLVVRNPENPTIFRVTLPVLFEDFTGDDF